MRVLVNKTKHSFELFLAERISAVSFIASSQSCQDLSDDLILSRIFKVMKHKFGGFVDLGFIDPNGIQISYAGPYQLKGKNYINQGWYKEMRLRGAFISDVFLGYRQFPHFVIAVERSQGECGPPPCVLRATIDTDRFRNLIASMRLSPSTDAFLVNRAGVMQTTSRFYGQVLETFPLPMPPVSYEPNVVEVKGPKDQPMLLAYTYFESRPFVLIMIKPKGEALKTWFALKSELFLIFGLSVVIISLIVFKISDLLVKRVQESDTRREAAYRELQHSSNLASIGRVAAGVAHEINNPLAIINEKAGLIKDLVEFPPDFEKKDKYLSILAVIQQSVERCRTITHRLLGFARTMEVNVEVLDLNHILIEVLGFLEKEAFYRNIDVSLQLAEDLPRIASDRGQLQQVFLNILNNAFDAVEEGGQVIISTRIQDLDTVAVSITDNGRGMSEETMAHIFEPFFTTRKGHGTGLGLSITYGIIKNLGGSITVQSQEGQLTTFTVFLPQKVRKVGTNQG
jgi:two-component system NtrC family sensor kinase